MKLPLWLCAWLLTAECVMILVFIPGRWTDRAIQQESALIKQHFGTQGYLWIETQASKWFRASMIDSGIYAGVRHAFLPDKAQHKRSKGIENFARPWFTWIEGRIKALMNVIYQFYVRLALLLAWLPYMLILLIPATLDGWLAWKIKRTNFDYVSPVIHRYSLQCLMFLLMGLGLIFLLPLTINPMIIPAAMMIACVLLGWVLGNWQKRI